ncbi:hypothetical protein [Streptomyces apocyni]|uniref:hypothetical protein n=1 Tax=Streptomyces apocyni TaxID=2654677 RepID=UPI003899DAE2
MAYRARRAGWSIVPRDLFSHPTIERLAAVAVRTAATADAPVSGQPPVAEPAAPHSVRPKRSSPGTRRRPTPRARPSATSS